MYEWLNGKRKERPEVHEDTFGLILCKNGTAKLVEGKNDPYEVPVSYAIGSGSNNAMGAILAGKSPKEAVEIAIQLDEYSGGDVVVMSFDETPNKETN